MRSLENEMMILSDMMQDNEIIAEVITALTDKDFQNSNTKMLFSAIKSMYKKNLDIDVASIPNYITKDMLNAIGGVSFIAKTQMTSPGTKGWETHLRNLKRGADLEKVKDALKTASAKAQNNDDPQEIIRGLMETEIGQAETVGGTISGRELMELMLESTEKAYKEGGRPRGISTGFTLLDHITGGFNKGDLMVLAARPSMGKTALSLNMIAKIPKQNNVMLFEMEMNEEKIGARLVSSRSGIPSKNISLGALKENDWDRFIHTVNNMGENLFLNCKTNLTTREIATEARKIKLKHGLDVVFIDHIGKIRPDNIRSSRNDQIGQISNDLKNMAKDLEVCVVALSQLNRGVEQRENKRPMLSDLRDSGNIEADADQVLMLYREDYYQEVEYEKTTMEVIVAKNRDGENTVMYLDYDLRNQLIKQKNEV
jgi:replicative DNA helicase